MEALWNFEDKLKVSTTDAAAMLAFAAFAAAGVCTATILVRKLARPIGRIDQEPGVEAVPSKVKSAQCSPSNSLGALRGLLMRTAQWSQASKWKGCGGVLGLRGSFRLPLIGKEQCRAAASKRWHSHNSTSPVWQRPILMGGKCELPRFSGLILYDEKGQPLLSDEEAPHQEKQDEARTALKDLL